MNNETLKIIIFSMIAILLIIAIIYLVIRRITNKSEYNLVKQLRKGTEEKKFSNEIFFQKLYMFFMKVPFLKRYLTKLRRRLEIINVQDEYLTRKQSAKILGNMIIIMIPVTILIIWLNRNNMLVLSILLIAEVFFIDLYIEARVDKLDNKLLKQQVDFFSDIRHSYHEVKMVDEAIYQVVEENEDEEISRQAQEIYEILNADEPEVELEKYYDVAPNAYLKEFAGISYLTKEYGDREINGASLYLKNLNDITRRNAIRIAKKRKIRLYLPKLICN